MPLIAFSGATSAGATFYPVATPSRPLVSGLCVCLVGDTSTCSAHQTPQPTTILPSGSLVTVNGVEVARVGSPTSCGHPIVAPGPNSVLQDNTVAS